jgi:T-complex protein 1 subunit theta
VQYHQNNTDIERAIDDGVNMVRAMTKNGQFVAGAGAVEIELARRLNKFGSTQSGLEQYAIKKYAESLGLNEN